MAEFFFNALAPLPELLIARLFQNKFGLSERTAYTVASVLLATAVLSLCLAAWLVYQ